jgi:serine/threonine protein kinase
MKICPACQVKFPDDAVVCGHCGARLLLDTSATMPEPKAQLIGKVIAGNYKITKVLGQGGMGLVFQARQLSLERDVAVKVLLAPLAMDKEILERFQREARGASNIGHSGIVQVFDMGYLKEGPPFIVMELLDGEDLRHKLNHDGALEAGEAIPIVLQLCDALQAAHDKGIIHRDLKPDNIYLVPRRGKGPIVKILDFGLSKFKSADKTITNTGTLLGTPNYMAPEQIAGAADIDARADLYAVGAIFYEMMTGRMAYEGTTIQSIFYKIMSENPPPPRTLRPDIPPGVEGVILKAMAKERADRYADLGQMASELVRVGSDIGIPRSQMSVLPSMPDHAQAGPPASQSPEISGAAPFAPPIVSAPQTAPPASPYPQYSQPAPSPYPYGYSYGGQQQPPPFASQTPVHLPAKPSRSSGVLIGVLATLGALLLIFIVFMFSCGIIVQNCSQGCAQGMQNLNPTVDVQVYGVEDGSPDVEGKGGNGDGDGDQLSP